GGNSAAAVIKASNVQVNDGLLTIALTNVVNNAKISGIAVFRHSEETPVNQPPVVSRPPDVMLNPGQSFNYQILASDPDAGSVLTYSA
ncbi:hypothetical protein GZH53_00160, partial [Flavihumibacter sp. R14]|nr:hypothetical protein [Flavihumibacter soli]